MVLLNRKPPKTQYRIRALRSIHARAKKGPTQWLGAEVIHGIAKGKSKMPDSPESAGFFDATKNTQAKTAIAANRNSVAATVPPFDLFRMSMSHLRHKLCLPLRSE